MSTTAPLTDDDRVLAAEYALRLLPAKEEAAFEVRMFDDRRLEAFVAETVGHFAPLSDEIAPERPSRKLKGKLMSDLFGVAQTPGSLWDGLSLWRATSLGATFAAAVLAILLVTHQAPVAPSQTERGALFVSEIASEDSSLRLLAVYDAGTGDLQLTRTAGAAAPDRVLELWAIAGDTPPVSLCVLPAGEKARTRLPDAVAGDVAGLVLAISDEPPGGSPTGAPTGAVLAVGGVTEI
ncbi:anti-sigma-K factor RskA [Litoreibacter ponti]|uniref:Anti-sigma-K factor RskA n=1 Tax=Litoreibacter ponti TaxID=1510457 RepID=A0A2T6BJV9_9RHOB|nr:anti-sigma factor [Litoreibacter ponti]PTX56349.1 anti-sigma-K factor RskA [Litoreibacter ponti]